MKQLQASAKHDSSPSLRELARPAWIQLQRLWKPFVLIQLIGLGVVIAYFNHAGFARACDAAAALKTRVGWPFAMIVMPIMAGIVPELFKFITGVDRKLDRRRVRDVLFNMAIFSLAGLYIDLFYRFLGGWLGDSRDVGVVALKVGIDQLIYTPLIGIPWIVICYSFRAVRYSPGRLLGRIGWDWYLREVVPVLIPCWAYWMPMCVLMYLMPPSLTFIYGALASAASATLLVAVAARGRERT